MAERLDESVWWQVGDSNEQNGSFNMALTNGKKDLLDWKYSLGLQNEGTVDSDLIPLINKAWDESFTIFEKNKNAISDQGRWNPLKNYLLLDQTLRCTMTTKDRSEEYNQPNQTISPNRHQSTSDWDSPITFFDDSTNMTDTDATELAPDRLPICDDLNFSTWMSQYCLKAYLSN